ncbi:MAG: DegV family protein, partial [Dorea sp.]
MIRIIVDSSADYRSAELEEKKIELVPLTIMFGGKTYIEDQNLTRDGFYEMLSSTEEFPTTSQPSPEKFVEFFKDAKEKGDDVICILLSSALSGTCQSALLAKSIADY